MLVNSVLIAKNYYNLISTAIGLNVCLGLCQCKHIISDGQIGSTFFLGLLF